MKRILSLVIVILGTLCTTFAQERRPVDSEHPMWLVHVDVWNKADPQKIIDLIPEAIRPYVVMNLSLSCGYDPDRDVYKMPQSAVKTYRSWATICQLNGMWFTCQPASGGHTHLHDDDLETFEYFYKQYPNFLGWNFAEQFWGFDVPNDKSSSSQADRIALFAKLVPMAHKYGGFLTISFCGNIWSHPLNPMGMMKRNADLLNACKAYPEAILWLYKYTTSSCFYNNESVCFAPFVAGLAKNYGVRYDNCGWNGALDALLGENHGRKYPCAAGYGTVMEQTCVNGGAVWDGPELIWTEDFQNLSNSTVDGYTRRNWGIFPSFRNGWLDMFAKIVDGSMYIPSREEVVAKTKIYVVNNVSSGNDEDKYAAWGDLYDGLYKQQDPFNRGNGQWMDNFCYFKKSGRYGAIPVGLAPYDEAAKAIPVKTLKSARWGSQKAKVDAFNEQYPEVSQGDLYVNRYRNQLVTYTPYTYMNKKKRATGRMPLLYNTCDSLILDYGLLSTGLVHEYADHVDLYLNNYRSDTTGMVLDQITIKGATEQPTYTVKKRTLISMSEESTWDAATGTFVLSVKHNGGVDVSIRCAGSGVDRATDTVSCQPLELPKQPAAYRGPITIEAEDMDFKSLKSCVTDPYGWYPSVRGHSGNGFMDMGTNTAGAVKHLLRIKEGGDYRLTLRYNNTSNAGNVSVSVNGAKQTVQIRKTGNNVWTKSTVNVKLKDGANTLVITNTGGVAFYLDYVTYTPADMEDEKFDINIHQAEHGRIELDEEKAAEGTLVKLNVIPDEGYALVGWKQIHGNVTISKENTFPMPCELVTLEPVFKDMTLTYGLDFQNVLAGTIPQGWVCTQENNDIHQYPNSFSSGARVFAGFNGYQGKALYWREQSCEYGRQSTNRLTLEPGEYSLTWATASWQSSPKYKVSVLSLDNKVIASETNFLAKPDVGRNQAAKVSSAEEHVLKFEVTEKGNYVISFTNLDAVGGYDEFLLLECRVNLLHALQADDIASIYGEEEEAIVGIYTIEGRKLSELQRGLNVIRLKSGQSRRLWVK